MSQNPAHQPDAQSTRSRFERIVPFLTMAGLVLIAFGFLSFIYDFRFDAWAAVHFIAGGSFAIAGLVGTWFSNLGRQAKQKRSKARIVTLIANSIFAAGLVFGYLIVERAGKQWDFTENKIHSLSEESRVLLERLVDPPVSALYFAQEGDAGIGVVSNLLDRYEDQSDSFEWELVDPEQEPMLAREFKVTDKGTLVVKRADRTETVLPDPQYGFTEATLNNALMKLSRQTTPTLYWIEGHNESAPNDAESPRGGALWAAEIEKEGISLKPWLLLVEGSIPSDADAIIIAGPLQTFSDDELEMIQNYLLEGGRAAILLEPQVDSGLELILESYGLTVRDDLILSPERSAFGDRIGAQPVVEEFADHPAHRGFRGRIVTPTARSFTLNENKPEAFEVQALAETTESAWGETNFDALRNGQATQEASDTEGPLVVAASIEVDRGLDEQQRKLTRLFVVGDADFAANAWFNRLSHREWLGRQIQWLIGEEAFVSKPPKDFRPSTIELEPEQERNLWRLSVWVLPEALILIGLAISWWRRSL